MTDGRPAGSARDDEERWVTRAAALAGLRRGEFTRRAELAYARQVCDFFERTVVPSDVEPRLFRPPPRGPERRRAAEALLTIEARAEGLAGGQGFALGHGFTCGVDQLDAFLNAQVNDRDDGAQVQLFLASSGRDLVGFFAICRHRLELSEAPKAVRDLFGGRVEAPCAYLAAVGVRVSRQGEGIGRWLIRDAMVRASAAADGGAVAMLLTDAKNSRLARYYASLGGVMLVPDVGRMLFVAERGDECDDLGGSDHGAG